MPFHLSFNFLLDVVSAARSEGQPLTETLARLQQAAIGGQGGSSSWGGEQIKVLETLLGKEFLDRLFSMSSQDVLQFLHSELSGRMDSESASELLAKGRLASLLAPGESSLFSSSIREFLRQELSSGGVSSFGSSEVGGSFLTTRRPLFTSRWSSLHNSVASPLKFWQAEAKRWPVGKPELGRSFRNGSRRSVRWGSAAK